MIHPQTGEQIKPFKFCHKILIQMAFYHEDKKKGKLSMITTQKEEE